MKWDGQLYSDIIKERLYSILEYEIPRATELSNKEYADYLKKRHRYSGRYNVTGKPDILAETKGITITFRDRVLNNLGDKTITLTWSMAARHIRAWEYEKQHNKITSTPLGQKSEEEEKMTFDLNTMLGAPMNNNVQVQQIPVDMLEPYHNHKFQLYTGERLDDMVDSIQKNGVLNPIIVQPIASGRYEILIGHNRWNASKLAGKPVVPAIIKTGLSEEEAEMYVIESNIMQRGFNSFKISVQAAVLAMRHKEMFSQGKRNDIIRELQLLENPQLAADDETEKKPQTTSDKVGAEYGMSRNSVARLLRIDTLHDTIKEWVDAGLSIRAGVELSYIDAAGQEMLVEYMQFRTPETDTSFSVVRSVLKEKATKALREAFLSGLISEPDDIPIVLEKPVKTAAKPLKIDSAIAQRYFTKGESQKEISATIEKALELYFSQRSGEHSESESQEEECELDGYGLSEELLKILKENGKKNIDDVREWMLCGNGEDTLSPELWDEVYVLLED